MNESLVYFGDAVKALDDNGRVGGYSVRHSDAGRKDLSGEYFVADTYLGAHQGDGMDALFHHGQPLPVKGAISASAAATFSKLSDHLFAPVKTRRDDIGLWTETVLDLADEYEKAVFGLVKAGKLGWSTGTASHTAKREADGKITRWPIIEISLTPTPCEPLNRAIPIKSFDSLKFVSFEDEEPDAPAAFELGALAAKLNRHIDDIVDEGHPRNAIVQRLAAEAGIQMKAIEAILAGRDTQPADAKLRAFARVLDVDFAALKARVRHDQLQTVKGMFEEALADRTPSRWELDSVYSEIISKLASVASASNSAGVQFDLESKVQEAGSEYLARLNKHAVTQIQSYVTDGGDEPFYLKAIITGEDDLRRLSALGLDDLSRLAVSALCGVINRFRANHEARAKSGRVLSEKNRSRLLAMVEQITAVSADIKALLDESQAMASEAETRAAITRHLKLKTQRRASTGA